MNYKRLFIQNSLVFITIVTNKRIPLLLDNIKILRNSVLEVKEYYDFDIMSYVILKDHIHAIIKPADINNYPKIIRAFKYNVGIAMPTYDKVWQNRYYEHTIRDENDLYKHLDYIHYNPFKHYNISPKNWVYSSFNEYTKLGYYEVDWCNVDDKNKINNLNYE